MFTYTLLGKDLTREQALRHAQGENLRTLEQVAQGGPPACWGYFVVRWIKPVSV